MVPTDLRSSVALHGLLFSQAARGSRFCWKRIWGQRLSRPRNQGKNQFDAFVVAA